MSKMYDNITGRSPIATDDLGYIGTGNKASDILNKGTTDYNDLNNKPTINNVELQGNLTSSDLGLQPELNEAQTNAVNSGITAALAEQITTNENNISLLTPTIEKTAYACTAADTYEYTGISVNVPSQQVFEINITDFSNACTAIAISDSNSNLASGYNLVAENATEYSVGNTNTWSRQVSCITAPPRPANKLYYVWIKRSNTTSSDIQVVKRRLI